VKVLVDMNLSPAWIPVLLEAGFEAVHWSALGEANAPDIEIMNCARKNRLVVFTHDLDFGSILATTNAGGPSVVKVRTQDITPAVAGRLITSNLQRFQVELERGALLVIEEARSRVRILPLNLS
jgi:predicted nuclease of predicted toxin-antitoxin system